MLRRITTPASISLFVGVVVVAAVAFVLGAQVARPNSAEDTPVLSESTAAQDDSQVELSAARTNVDAASADSTNESIEVHGNWTIDVLDPDGTLVSRNVFHNDLLGSGDNLIAGLLSTSYNLHYWSLRLTPSASDGVCQFENGNPTSCTIMQDTSTDINGFSSVGGLVVTGPTGTSEPDTLVFGGSVIAVRDGSVGIVSTSARVDGTNFDGTITLTSRVLDSAITVLEGQQVQASVEVSFANPVVPGE